MLGNVVAAACGYCFTDIISGNAVGEKGLFFWQSFIDYTGIHLHHWFIFLVLFMLIYICAPELNSPTNSTRLLVMSFLAGGVVQGLTYEDCFEFVDR